MSPNPAPQHDSAPEDERRPGETRRAAQTAQKDERMRSQLIFGILIGIVALLTLGIVPRFFRTNSLDKSAQAQQDARLSVPEVSVLAPAAEETLALPGNIEAVDQTAIVARASGYVQSWSADIGDHVKAGQVLAVIATPDLDQELDQAQAQLASSEAAYVQSKADVSSLEAKINASRSDYSKAEAALDESRAQLVHARVEVLQGRDAVARQQADLLQAQANSNLAHVTATRYLDMLKDGAVDQQSTDEAVAADQTNQANVQALQASLHAAQGDVQADEAEVMSALSNVQAYASAVRASQSDIDAAQANLLSGQANVQAAADIVASNQANVARIRVLKSFQDVTAPFTGVITARNIDIGSLVTSSGAAAGGGSDIGSGVAGASGLGNAAGGSGSGGATSSGSGGVSNLFSIAKLQVLRVYVNVPQSDIDAVAIGKPAVVQVSEYPGRSFHGIVARTADALDPISRTLVAEVRLNNPGNLLLPGTFAQVLLNLASQPGSALIPDSALITNAAGNQVAVIEPNDTIHFQQVTIGRDFGKQIEITSGLTPGQKIVPTPGDGLIEGEAVSVSNT